MIKNKYRLIKLKRIDSTNTYLKALAENGEPEGCIVVAEEQSMGRGRRGKSFFSPADTGLYMSILVRPEFSIEDSLFLTSMTAVATCRAIEGICNTKCGIKWVNDIYIDSKKVAGILCEGSFNHNEGKINYIVAGIGVNISVPKDGFPEELKEIAASLGSNDIRDELMHKIADEFFLLYKRNCLSEFIEEYKARSVLTGKKIEVLGDSPFVGKAIGIDEQCRLIVEKCDGSTVVLSSGEVSTKIAR